MTKPILRSDKIQTSFQYYLQRNTREYHLISFLSHYTLGKKKRLNDLKSEVNFRHIGRTTALNICISRRNDLMNCRVDKIYESNMPTEPLRCAGCASEMLLRCRHVEVSELRHNGPSVVGYNECQPTNSSTFN